MIPLYRYPEVAGLLALAVVLNLPYCFCYAVGRVLDGITGSRT